ncbi:MAG: hypothetical protein QXR53_01950 [Candidatus Norongarragalinales archaeon]
MTAQLNSLSYKAGFSYDWHKTYDENYDSGPKCGLSEEDWRKIDSFRKELDSKLPKRKFLGFTVNSTLGIAAGPLLNHKYVNHYYRLGFDMPVQKTVRSVFTKAHPFPNVMLINVDHQLSDSEIGSRTVARLDARQERLSITNSFGMPSKSVEEWTEDFKKTTPAEGQLKLISVVGTPPSAKGKTGCSSCVSSSHSEFQHLAEDFASLAQLGFEGGAQAVEMNFSCPNVTGKEGQIYTNAESAKEICKTAREQVGNGKKLIVKLGFYKDYDNMAGVLEAVTDYADGVCAINTIPLEIVDENGVQAMPGEGRLRSGVCGYAIRDLALRTINDFAVVRKNLGRDFAIIGVGGITQPQDALEFFEFGADAIQIATGAMWDQLLGMKIKTLLLEKTR